jgi:hypothetical protein
MINISKIFRIYFLHGNFIFQQKKLNFFKNTVVSPRLSQSREFTRAHVSSRELTQTHVSSRELTCFFFIIFFFFFLIFFSKKLIFVNRFQSTRFIYYEKQRYGLTHISIIFIFYPVGDPNLSSIPYRSVP